MAITVVNTGITYGTIQAAIDAALNGAGLTEDTEVTVDDGIYQEDVKISGLTHATNGFTFTLRGTGDAVYIDGQLASRNNLVIEEIANIVIDRINLENCDPEDLGGANLYITGPGDTDPTVTENITFKNATIRVGYAASRMVESGRNILIENVIVSNAKYGGFRWGNPPDVWENITIRNCTFSQSLESANGLGTSHLLMKQMTDLTVENCTFYETGRDCMSLESCVRPTIKNCISLGSGLVNSSGSSIFAYKNGALACEDIVVESCLFYGSEQGKFMDVSNYTSVRVANCTFVDSPTATQKSQSFYFNALDALEWFNNLVEIRRNITTEIIKINAGTLDYGVNFFADYNLYHLNHSNNRKVWGGDGATYPEISPFSTGLGNIQAEGLETNSTYHNVQADNWLEFTDYGNLDFTIGATSPARNTADDTEAPLKDVRYYDRVFPNTDRGAYDMDAVAPVQPVASFTVESGGIEYVEPFGIVAGTDVTLTNTSTGSDTRTFEIVENGQVIPGGSSNANDFTFTFNDAGTYTLRLIAGDTGGAPNDIETKANFVIVGTAPAITDQPDDLSVEDGQNATFTVAASGDPAPTIQWQRSDDNGANWADIAGANAVDYTLPATLADDGAQFRAIAANLVQPDATSNVATLTVTPVPTAPAITDQPDDQTVQEGQTATFTVVATGYPAVSYQWQRSDDNGANWVNLAGEVSNTLEVNPAALAQDGYQYRVLVSNGVNPDATSNAATLTVTPPPTAPTITDQPDDQTVQEGQTATFEVAASGYPAVSHQWQRSDDNGANWANVGGATNSSLEVTPASVVQDGDQYRVVVSNGVNPDATSNAATLTVNPAQSAPQITDQPADQTVLVNDTATFTVVATGQPAVSYQWQRSDDNGANWSSLPGETNSSYQVTPASLGADGTQYRVVVSNGVNPAATSNAATLTVTESTQAPVITQQPTAQTVNEGQAVTFNLTATGVPAPSYSWEGQTPGSANWVPAGQDQNSLTIDPVDDTYDGWTFRCVVSNNHNGGTSVTSATASLTVNPPATAPVFTQQPQDKMVGELEPVTFITAATGDPAPTYQWQRRASPAQPWENIAGATGSAYSFNATLADSGAQFRVVASNVAGDTNSDPAALVVFQNQIPPSIDVEPGSISDHYDQIMAIKDSSPELAGLPVQGDSGAQFLEDTGAGSKIGVWRVWAWVMATLSWLSEKLFQVHKKEVEETIKKNQFGTQSWYEKTAKEFQYGDALVWNGEAYVYEDTESEAAEAKRIIQRVALVAKSGTLQFKVATLTNDTPTPLGGAQKQAFFAHMALKAAPGSNIIVTSENADDFRVEMTVYYDPLIMNPDGSLINDPATFPVKAAIDGYITNLPFNGRFSSEDFFDKIRHATGIKDREPASTLQARYGALEFQNVGRFYVPFAGHMKLNEAQSTIKYIKYV